MAAIPAAPFSRQAATRSAVTPPKAKTGMETSDVTRRRVQVPVAAALELRGRGENRSQQQIIRTSLFGSQSFRERVARDADQEFGRRQSPHQIYRHGAGAQCTPWAWAARATSRRSFTTTRVVPCWRAWLTAVSVRASRRRAGKSFSRICTQSTPAAMACAIEASRVVDLIWVRS